MTIEEAQAIWSELSLPGEGWLDAQVRHERKGRRLSALEREAADVLWRAFVAGLREMAETFAAIPNIRS